jgi:hypothetical protein
VQAAQCVGERGGANPVHLGAEAEGGTYRVHMRINQPGDDRSSLEIDRARLRTSESPDIRVAADGGDPSFAHRQCTANRELRIDRDNLAADENCVDLLRRRGRRHYREDCRNDRARNTMPHLSHLQNDHRASRK